MIVHKALPVEDWDAKVTYRRRCACGWETYWARHDVADELLADHLANHAAEVGAA